MYARINAHGKCRCCTTQQPIPELTVDATGEREKSRHLGLSAVGEERAVQGSTTVLPTESPRAKVIHRHSPTAHLFCHSRFHARERERWLQALHRLHSPRTESKKPSSLTTLLSGDRRAWLSDLSTAMRFLCVRDRLA